MKVHYKHRFKLGANWGEGHYLGAIRRTGEAIMGAGRRVVSLSAVSKAPQLG